MQRPWPRSQWSVEIKDEEAESEEPKGSRNPKNRYRRRSPSPPRRHKRRWRLPAVQIYHEIGSGWPMLTWSNNYEWSLLMKVKLQALFLWDAITLNDVDCE